MSMLPTPVEHPTMTIPEAADALGLSRGATYAAAARGDIPAIRIGGRIVVPTAELRRLLGLDPTLDRARQ